MNFKTKWGIHHRFKLWHSVNGRASALWIYFTLLFTLLFPFVDTRQSSCLLRIYSLLKSRNQCIAMLQWMHRQCNNECKLHGKQFNRKLGGFRRNHQIWYHKPNINVRRFTVCIYYVIYKIAWLFIIAFFIFQI